MTAIARTVGRVGFAALIAVIVVIGVVTQAGAYLLAFTTPPTTQQAGERVTEFSEAGPFPVGVRTIPAEFGSPQVTMWYPAMPTDDTRGVTYSYGVRLLSPDSEMALATYTGRATLGAAFDQMMHPLVLLSHGFALTPESYGWLGEHLASHGMVVVAPDHAETLDPGRLWMATIDRPNQLRAVVDALEVRSGSGGDLEGVIDMSTVAVVGHSYGGYAALAAAGARIDGGSLVQTCDDARRVDDPIVFLCDALEPHIEVIEEDASVTSPALGVDAVVSIAGDAMMFGQSGLARMDAPVMVIGGTADTDTPFSWGPGFTYQHAGSERKVEVGLEGAGHLVFAGRCDMKRRLLTIADLGFCSDPAWDREDAQAVVKHHVTAFLRFELLGDSGASRELKGHRPDIPGVLYRSGGYG